jgi:hypothetical protein
MKYVKTFEQFISESIVTEDERKYIAFIEEYGEDNIREDLEKFIVALEAEGFSEDTLNNAREVYGKTNEDVFNEEEEPEAKEEPKSKVSLNETVYEAIACMYKEACEAENDENPTHTFEGCMKESFLLMAEMATRVLKESTDYSKVAAKAAMKKCNEKDNDEAVISDKTHEYLNEMMKAIKEAYTTKMDEMMAENVAIGAIGAKALLHDTTIY